MGADDGADERMCRICYGESGAMIRPCLCRGSQAFCHVECLAKWLSAPPARRAKGRCGTCGARYRLQERRRGAFPWRACAAAAVMSVAALAYASLLPWYACRCSGHWVEWRPDVFERVFLPADLVASINAQQWTRRGPDDAGVCRRQGPWDPVAALVYGVAKLSWVGLVLVPWRYPDLTERCAAWMQRSFGATLESLVRARLPPGYLPNGPLLHAHAVRPWLDVAWFTFHIRGGRAFGANMPKTPAELVPWLVMVGAGLACNADAALELVDSTNLGNSDAPGPIVLDYYES